MRCCRTSHSSHSSHTTESKDAWQGVEKRVAAAHMSTLCRAWKVKCIRCDTAALHAIEAKAHPMQWPDDLLEVVWDTVRENGMLLANLKKRLWKGVHTDLFSLVTDTQNLLSGYAFVPRRRQGTMKGLGYIRKVNLTPVELPLDSAQVVVLG